MNRHRLAVLMALAATVAAAPAEALTPRQMRSLRCRCCGAGGIDVRLLRLLDELQRLRKDELLFTSGVRCPAHNARAGGVPNSRHLRGQAADVAMPARRQPAFCALARRLGFRRVLADARRNYVHLSL